MTKWKAKKKILQRFLNTEPKLSHYCDAMDKEDVDVDILLNRFNEKRIDDLAKTFNMSFGLQVLFFYLIMKNKQIGYNNDTLTVNCSIIQVNSPKITSKSKINRDLIRILMIV